MRGASSFCVGLLRWKEVIHARLCVPAGSRVTFFTAGRVCLFGAGLMETGNGSHPLFLSGVGRRGICAGLGHSASGGNRDSRNTIILAHGSAPERHRRCRAQHGPETGCRPRVETLGHVREGGFEANAVCKNGDAPYHPRLRSRHPFSQQPPTLA
jgi:hypothetical protein